MSEDRPDILLVDDEASLREPLAEYLVRQGFGVTQAASAAEARSRLRDETPDLVLLDIMMPGEDGISLCRHLVETRAIPTIFLTARGEATDRIVGLEIGADDYVVKPFEPRELVARIRSVLRRAARAGPAPVAEPVYTETTYVEPTYTEPVYSAPVTMTDQTMSETTTTNISMDDGNGRAIGG